MDDQTKKLLLFNINRLIKKAGLKVGELEQQAGLSAGLISRWRKGNEPDLNKIYEIAKVLGVSLDYLLSPVPNTQSHMQAISFLRNILHQTHYEEIQWKEHSVEAAEGEYGPITSMQTIYPGSEFKYPQYMDAWTNGTHDAINILWTGYYSLGYGREIKNTFYDKVSIKKDSYFSAQLPDINSSVWLYCVEYGNGSKTNILSPVYEIYLETGNKPQYLFNSVEWGNDFEAKLSDLYQAAAEQCSRVRIEYDTLKLLQQYNQKIKPQRKEKNNE